MIADNELIMCQLCFGGFYKDQLTPVRNEPPYTHTDVCLVCTAKEHLAEMRLWVI